LDIRSYITARDFIVLLDGSSIAGIHCDLAHEPMFVQLVEACD